jgi:hypothetical protein
MKPRGSRITWAIGVLLVSGLLAGSRSSRADPPPPVDASPRQGNLRGTDQQVVSVDASLKHRTAAEFVLEMTLRYTGDKDLRVWNSSLPWGNTYSLILVGVEAHAMATPLEKFLRIDDPVTGDITIKPGQALTGEVDLTQRFRNLTSALNRIDVLIFWSYQLQPIDGKPLPRVGGWLVIPKTAGRAGLKAPTRGGTGQ